MNNNLISISFVLPGLDAGGAQRIVSFLSQRVDKSKFKCTLLVIGKSESTDFNVSNIEVHYFNKERLLYAVNPLFLYIYKNKPNIVMGSIGHVNKLLAFYSFLLPKTKFIGREASLNSILSLYNKSPHFIKFDSIFKGYRKKLKSIICQSTEMAEHLLEQNKIHAKQICIINNPLTIEAKIKTSEPVNDSVKKLITVGRLSKEKGHERLLNNLARLKTDWHYTIIGTGNEYENIMAQIKTLKLQDRVTYIEHTNNVTKYLSESDLFLQGSYIEGFPNAVMESCAIGTPVVAYNAPGGTKEIIQDGINGFIAKNESNFIELVKLSLNEQEWDVTLISKSITERFDENIIISKYEQLFLEVAQSK